MAKKLNLIVFRTAREWTTGLIGMKPILGNTVFVFPHVAPGTVFHSRGVLEPFDLAFVDGRRRVLSARRMTPERDVMIAPARTVEAWESKAGVLIG